MYQSQISPPHTRWKALDEIYQIYIPLYRSELEISVTFRPKILWLDLEEWLIQDKMIRDLFSGVYVTAKDELSQSAKKNLLHICELILLGQALQ